jgi:nitrous oxidase accessory protein NosD
MPTSVKAGIIYVDDSYPSEDATHKKTIQAGVDAAQPGDTIYVYNGTYYENVIVDKTLNLTGENRNTTIVDGNGTGIVIRLTNADYINLTNLGFRNGETGIYIDYPSSNYNNISWNRIYNIFSIEDAYGINGGTFTTFYKNTIYDVSTNGTDRDAIGIAVVSSNTVLCNTVSDVFSSSRFAEGIRIADLNNVSFNDVFNISSNGSDGGGTWEQVPKAIGYSQQTPRIIWH